MAYNVAANLQQVRPGAAFMRGRDTAIQNALTQRQAEADMQAQEFSQANTLFNQNRAMAQDQAAAAANQAEAQKQAEHEDKAALFTYFSHLAKLKANPDAFNATAQRMVADPLFQRHNITIEDLTPDQIDEVLPVFAAQAGQAPAADPVQYERVDGPRGSILQRDPRTGEMKQVVGPDNSQPAPPKSPGSYRPLSQQEIQAAGLPPGTSAQVGPDGKIDVISKRDNTGVLSQKDQTTAKMKLNTVSLARQQLNKIKEAFAEGTKGVNAFGPGQGYMPTQAGKKFDARVNQMRSTLTALTRVPGVGAMSDYETKLDQSKFPSRTAYESVTADTLQNLEDQLALIENGYKELLSGGGQDTAPAAGGWSVQRVK
jgi:hypothetical protein